MKVSSLARFFRPDIFMGSCTQLHAWNFYQIIFFAAKSSFPYMEISFSCMNEIETWNWEEIPFSSRLVLRGLSVAEGPLTALYNAAHLYSDHARLEPANSSVGSRHRNHEARADPSGEADLPLNIHFICTDTQTMATPEYVFLLVTTFQC